MPPIVDALPFWARSKVVEIASHLQKVRKTDFKLLCTVKKNKT